MDATDLARCLLAPVPVHRTLGLRVDWAGDGCAEVSMPTPESMTNVIGSLHSSGLVNLVDSAGLAAIIGSCERADNFDGLVPLGAAASMQFLAPARGRLTARCSLAEEPRRALARLYAREVDTVRVETRAVVVDSHETLVCEGSFVWSVRRAQASASPATRAPTPAAGLATA